MNDSKVIARRPYRPFDLAMDKIWITLDSVRGYKYILFHFMNHENKFGMSYIGCHNMTDLNEVKSLMLNNGFKVDWGSFNLAMEYLNDN